MQMQYYQSQLAVNSGETNYNYIGIFWVRDLQLMNS